MPGDRRLDEALRVLDRLDALARELDRPCDDRLVREARRAVADDLACAVGQVPRT